MKVTIYGLVDPRDNQVRYIGKTVHLEIRLAEHIKDAKKEVKTYKHDWIRSLLKIDLVPSVVILDIADSGEWQEAEKKVIAHYLKLGARLTNLTDGGDGLEGYNHSEETKNKIGQASIKRGSVPPNWKGRKQSSEHIRKRVEARKRNDNYIPSEKTKAKISKANTGKNLGNTHTLGYNHTKEWKKEAKARSSGENNPFYDKHHTEETKEKLRQANTGRVHTKEARQKMSKAQQGRTHTEEAKEKIRQANTGKVHSEETKQKLSEATKKQWDDPEFRRKIVDANIGREHTEETKRKISEASTGRVCSDETKAKISKAHKNKTLSEEHKANLKKAWIRRKARKGNKG